MLCYDTEKRTRNLQFAQPSNLSYFRINHCVTFLFRYKTCPPSVTSLLKFENHSIAKRPKTVLLRWIKLTPEKRQICLHMVTTISFTPFRGDPNTLSVIQMHLGAGLGRVLYIIHIYPMPQLKHFYKILDKN